MKLGRMISQENPFLLPYGESHGNFDLLDIDLRLGFIAVKSVFTRIVCKFPCHGDLGRVASDASQLYVSSKDV